MENVTKALQFGISLIGTPYDYCLEGINKKGPPLFAENGECPKKDEITSCDSVGLVNLILRYVGKELPFSDNSEIGIGETASYIEYYKKKGVIKDFELDGDYLPGTLLLRNYKDINDPGHLAIIIDCDGRNSKILQSNVDGEYYKSKTPGVNVELTLEENNKRFDKYYEYVVDPYDWIC